MRKIKTITIMAVSLLLGSMLLVTAIAQDKNENTYQDIASGPSQGSILWQAIGGMTGGITTEIKLVDQTNSGSPDTVLVGTGGGAMAIDILTGEVYTRYTTLDTVLSITDIADIDGGGRADFVITTRNQKTPNVIAVSTETGNKLWDFKPMVEAFTEEDGLIDMETISWSVDSISTDSGMDVVLSSWRNVYRLSGNNGDIKWTFEGNNDIWTVVVVNDLTGDGKPDVLAGSQDGDIHLLNGKTGDPVWEHDLTDIYEETVELDAKKGEEGGTVDISIDLSLWSILNIEDVDRDNVPDVVVSSEDGFITLISGESGNVIWSKKITLQNELIIDTENNVGVQSGIDDILNFFNPRIKTIDDFDGDGLRDILVMGITWTNEGTAKIISSSTGGPNPGTRQGKDRDPGDGGKTDPKDDDELVVLDQESILFNTTGTDAIDIPVIWSTEALVNWNGNGNYSLVLPHRNKIKLVDTQTKEVEPFFDHPILDNAWLGRFQLKFFDNPNGSQEQLMIMTLGISGLLVVDPQTQEVLWDVNNMESVEVHDIGDITGDGNVDLVVISSLGASSLARSIYAIDRVTGDPLWRYSVSLTDLATKGARDINLENDFTGDGHFDVLAYQQSDVPDDLLEMGNHSLVFVIDGANGSLAWERHVTDQLFYNSSLNGSSGLYEDWNVVNRRIATLDTAPDLNSDGIPDIFVGGQGGNVYLLDGSDGSQIWNMTSNDISWLPWYPQIFTVQDPSRSGLVITDFSSMIYFSNISVNGSLSANYSWRYPQNLSNPDNLELLPGSFRVIPDLNRDGRSDVMFFTVVPGEDKDFGVGEHECHILSGLDGNELGPGFSMGVGTPPQNSFAPGENADDEFFIQDLNDNGAKDAVIFKAAAGKRAPPQIIAIDGQTYAEIWVNDEIFEFALSGGNPLRIIEDINDDSTPDIAVGSSRWGIKGADIHIIDGSDGKLLNTIQYEEQTEFTDWNSAQPVNSISMVDDVSGDGNKDMMVQRTASINGEDVFVLELVDLQAGRLLRQVPVGAAVAKDNGDINSDGKTDILVSQGNSLYCLNGDYSLSILSPQDDDNVDEEFLLEWDLKGVECEVFVDGISYGYYNDGEAELTLTGGEHEIIIETTDEFGGVLSDTITVNVPTSNTPWIINIIAIIALIIFIVVLFAIRRAKFKKRSEEWREKRRKLEESKKISMKRSQNTDRKSMKRKKMPVKTKPKEVLK
jgi:outer membrane protein assembly factor BamB